MQKGLWLCLPALALLASCGRFSPDGRLFLSAPILATEYQLAGTFVSVGCDALNGQQARTTVRATFLATGFLRAVDMNLRGLSTNRYDEAFRDTFLRERGEFSQAESNVVTVKFTADAAAGVPFPNRVGLRPQSIEVNPAPVRVKEVRVDDRNQVGQGFVAVVDGVSDRGVRTGAVESLNSVAVYRDCLLVRETDEPL